MENIKKIHMGKAKCSVDLGDGSERGEYVSQDYILSRIGRPMRSISLMYCYYPFDKEWPARISDVMKMLTISGDSPMMIISRIRAVSAVTGTVRCFSR